MDGAIYICNKWKSINEPPSDSRKVLITVINHMASGFTKRVEMGSYDREGIYGEKGSWVVDGGSDPIHVNALGWMDLPEPCEDTTEG